MNNPMTVRNVLRAVKTLVIVIVSESFRIGPRLPFQVNLGFAKPAARRVLKFRSVSDSRLVSVPVPLARGT